MFQINQKLFRKRVLEKFLESEQRRNIRHFIDNCCFVENLIELIALKPNPKNFRNKKKTYFVAAYEMI